MNPNALAVSSAGSGAQSQRSNAEAGRQYPSIFDTAKDVESALLNVQFMQ
jgi:hypothetical protein